MSRILPGMMPARRLDRSFAAHLPSMIQETCNAEFIHLVLCVLSLRCLALWPGIGGAAVTVLYILGNIPFILI